MTVYFPASLFNLSVLKVAKISVAAWIFVITTLWKQFFVLMLLSTQFCYIAQQNICNTQTIFENSPAALMQTIFDKYTSNSISKCCRKRRKRAALYFETFFYKMKTISRTVTRMYSANKFILSLTITRFFLLWNSYRLLNFIVATLLKRLPVNRAKPTVTAGAHNNNTLCTWQFRAVFVQIIFVDLFTLRTSFHRSLWAHLPLILLRLCVLKYVFKRILHNLLRVYKQTFSLQKFLSLGFFSIFVGCCKDDLYTIIGFVNSPVRSFICSLCYFVHHSNRDHYIFEITKDEYRILLK